MNARYTGEGWPIPLCASRSNASTRHPTKRHSLCRVCPSPPSPRPPRLARPRSDLIAGSQASPPSGAACRREAAQHRWGSAQGCEGGRDDRPPQMSQTLAPQTQPAPPPLPLDPHAAGRTLAQPWTDPEPGQNVMRNVHLRLESWGSYGLPAAWRSGGWLEPVAFMCRTWWCWH